MQSPLSADVRRLITERAPELQAYGTIRPLSHGLDSGRLGIVDDLNQLLADTMMLRDLYKKHHWQVVGPTFYPLHRRTEKVTPARPSDRGLGRVEAVLDLIL